MLIVPRRVWPALAGLIVGLLAVLALCSSALATPITVNLRVEGSTATLYEGPVTTEAILDPPGIGTEASKEAHPCDVKDNGSNGGYGAAAATPTTALYEAAVAHGLAFNAEWSTEFNDFDILQVGQDIANSEKNGEYWGYAINFTTAELGGCQIRLAPGSEVLWAYNFFGLPHLLSLTAPASVDAGTPFSVHVVDGQTGQPISGAAIGEMTAGVTTTIPGSPTTDANGNATITLTHAGTVTLKATQSESVRSNGVVVCVHNGNDGTCGTTIIACPADTSGCEGVHVEKTLPPPPPLPDVARAGGVVNSHVYSRRGAPRILVGSVEVPLGDTLHEVRIALERSSHHRCFAFSGRRGAFARAGCHATRFFDVADTTSFSYLLPARLPAGRYVYDVEAVDDAGHVTKLADGVSHVVFYVK
jgi:hypothetical protein